MVEVSESMKKDELIEVASSKGLAAHSKLTKAELIEAIQKSESQDDSAKDSEAKSSKKSNSMASHPKFDKFKNKEGK